MLPRSRYPALLATLAVCAASTLSCKAHRTGVADARVLHITTSDYAFDAPAQLESGLVSIELFNRGPNLHEAQLLKLGAGKTLKDFSDSLGLPGTNSWVTSAGGVGALLAGDSARITEILEPGNYIIVCGVPDSSGKPHMMRGMVRSLTVLPSTVRNGVEGFSYDETLALNEFAFTQTPAFTSGHHVIRVTNNGTMSHSAVLIRLDSGVTTMQALKSGNNRGGSPPFHTLGGVAALPAGAEAFLPVDFTPGRYSLICFETDAHDGKAHLAKGMIKEFTIT